MNILQALRKPLLAAVAVMGLFAGLSATATPALARGGHVSIGIGLGVPLFFGPAWGYYAPPYPYYYPPYAAPPPVVYAPPPAVYAPPPAYYQQPLEAVPSSPVYRSQDGQYCREYQATVRVDGQYQNSYGTACQQPDGTWHVVN